MWKYLADISFDLVGIIFVGILIVLLVLRFALKNFKIGDPEQRRKRRRFIDLFIQLFGLSAGLIAGIISISSPIKTNNAKLSSKPIEPSHIERIEFLERELSKINSKLELLDSQKISQMAFSPSPSDSKVQTNSDDIIELGKKIKNFEGLLLTDAEQIVTLPLIKKDIETVTNEVVTLKALVQETQTQGRWMIGTLGLGIFGLIISLLASGFFSKGKKNSKEKSSGNDESVPV